MIAMKKSVPIYTPLIILGILSLGIYIWLSTKPAASPEKTAHSKAFIVKVIQPVNKSMPIYLEEVGTVTADNTVSVIPQATGVLKKILFQEGQNVSAGQPLFEIDDAVYAANLQQVKANWQRDAAQLALLKANTDRYQALAKLEYVTQQQYEEAQAAYNAQLATVAADKAQVEQATIQLSYTQIRAPITGKAGTVTVHPGDLISANSATPLVVINRMDPVLVNFNISQDRLPKVLRHLQQGALTVEIIHENNQHLIAKGQLTVVNNSVNTQTGTVELKAKVPNANLQLWPGQWVTIRLILAVHPDALVIPTSAVQLGQNGNYVYVVRGKQAVIQPITLAHQMSEEAIVKHGLNVHDQVIGEVPPGLTDGAMVMVHELRPKL